MQAATIFVCACSRSHRVNRSARTQISHQNLKTMKALLPRRVAQRGLGTFSSPAMAIAADDAFSDCPSLLHRSIGCSPLVQT